MPPPYQRGEAGAITCCVHMAGRRRVDFPHESEYEEGMLTFRQFLATIMGLAVAALIAGCKRGEPVKTLLLHDSGGARPRRFDDVRILGTKSDYVKFRTGSGEVIEFSGKYEIKR
jgi:hypothetical protein